MADEKPTRAIRTVQGEVVRADAPGHPSPVRKTLYRLISRLSTLPFFNRMSERAIDSAQKVIEAQNRLGNALADNQLVSARLIDIPEVVGKERANRKAERGEAELRLAKVNAAYEERFLDKRISQQLKDQELKRNEIADIELKIKLQKTLKEYEALRKIEEPPKKTRVADPIYSKVREGVKQAKTVEKAEKIIDESGLSEEKKKNLKKGVRIDLETRREEK